VVIAVVAVTAGLDRRARAGELGQPRPPVQLQLATCLDGERDAIERAVRVEVGEAPSADDAVAVAVRVECAADGLDAGVVLEVRPPGSARRYRYALDWRAQPPDARPRLIGLAVAEAVDASRIELTAVAEPPLPAPGRGAIDAAVAPRGAPDWSVALVADQRTFSARGGVDLLGVGLMPTRRLSPHLGLAADLIAESTTVLATSGAVAVLSVSAAPRIAYRTGGRLHGELGLGVRLGVVRMRGEALPGGPFAGASLVRLWLGPVADFAIGFELTPGLSLRAGFELGAVVAGATARDLGEPVAALGGTWTSFALAAAIAL
jgi:hypothetical protein